MFPSYLEVEKPVPSHFEPYKHCCSYLEREKSGSCYLETKNCSLQLLGASKIIMTHILSQKNWFTEIGSTK